MDLSTRSGRLNVPLFHGTSTVFLESIIESGLGGRNPVQEWNILDLASKVLSLSEEHLPDSELFASRVRSFRRMTQQEQGPLNWQHGDSYLSPAQSTAIRYCVNKKYGSEILTYTLEFLEELLRREVPGVRDDLFREFPDLFALLNIYPAPVVVKVSNVPLSALRSEHGDPPDATLEMLSAALATTGPAATRAQQINFRLCQPIPIESLSFSLVNVLRWHPLAPSVRLYEITGLTRNRGHFGP